MKTRRLGSGGPELTVIGFGAWAIGGPWLYGWGPVDDTDSMKAIQTAINLGVNWIDTAAVYGLGHSEEIVARATKDVRGKVFIATKCGLVWDDRGNVTNNLHPTSIRREVEASLRRLKTDVIGLYQFHWPDPSVAVEDSWETMLRLREEGKVQYLGVSNFDVPLLERCGKLGRVQSLQPPYSLLSRGVEEALLPYCLSHDIGVVAYSPLQSGLLTGKFDLGMIAADDWRRKNEMFQEPKFSKALSLVEGMRPIAAACRTTVSQLAVAWVLSHPAITSAIVGGRTPTQVKEVVGAAETIIPTEQLNRLHTLLQEVGW